MWASIPLGQFDAPQRGARSWEQFYDKDFVEHSVYLSEAAPAVWNAAWVEINRQEQDVKETRNVEGTRIFRPDTVLNGLFDLGLGFRSAFFTYDGDQACTREPSITALGISHEMTADLVREFGAVGLTFRSIEQFVKERYQKLDSCSSIVAVAAAIGGVAEYVKTSLLEIDPKPVTMLQLQDAFTRPRIVMERLAGLVESLNGINRDKEVINAVDAFVQSFEMVDPLFRPIALHILHMVANPFLQELGSYVGLKPSSSSSNRLGKAFSELERGGEEVSIDGGASVIESALPRMLDSEQKGKVTSIFHILKLLEIHDKGNALVGNQAMACSVPELEIAFGMEDIERIQRKATIYEASVKAVLDGHRNAVNEVAIEDAAVLHTVDPFELDAEGNVVEYLARTQNIFNEMPANLGDVSTNNKLRQALRKALQSKGSSDSELLPSLSVAVTSSLSPVLSAQLRLANHGLLRMLLSERSLIHHFELQYQFQLLGSGFFSTRLSQTLFSPNLFSAERRKGHTRSGIMGLRLGSRETWPPVDTELRLVLMGILSDSYQNTFSSEHLLDGSDDLPGDLSFSVRNLTEPEIEACLKPNSLQALDFLRLQYRPPPPLDCIFTKEALDKYDRIFCYLLRLKRVSYAVNHLNATRSRSERTPDPQTIFHVEARHFVNALLLYIHTSIASLWTNFIKTIEALQDSLNRDSQLPPSLNENGALTYLRDLHTSMLDQLLFGLQLRKRQETVMALIEDILGRILDFAINDGEAGSLPKFTEFREQVSLFVEVCRGLSTARMRRKDGQGHSVGIESLVAMLDGSGFYQRLSSRSIL